MSLNFKEDLALIRQLLDAKMRETFKGSEESYILWFNRMELRELDENHAYFVCENETKRQYIEKTYLGFLAKALESVLDYEPTVSIGVDTSLAPVIPDDGTVVSPLKLIREQEEKRRAALEKENREKKENPESEETYSSSAASDRQLTYNDNYTFENFVVGSSNAFAHAAALNVANYVGGKASTAANPLFIWGPSGLGKTHLMYAIANRVLYNTPSMRVICVKGEDFMNEMIEAISAGKNREFRNKYRKADMLLIDDIQFIAGKDATQREFFHTFDALYEEGKQIIITSDRPPKDLISLEERIRSRFEAGLLADIQPPDFELRLAILREKIEKSKLIVSLEVVDFLAKNLQENIRQLEGVVKKLALSNVLTGTPVTMEMVINTVPEYLRDAEPVTDTITRINETVARHFSVTVEDILGEQRKLNIKNARNVAMYLIQEITKQSLSQIGSIFGRDHSTVHSNICKVRDEMKSDPVFNAKVEEIVKDIKRSA